MSSNSNIGVIPDALSDCMSLKALSYVCALLLMSFHISLLTNGGYIISQLDGNLYFVTKSSVSHCVVHAILIRDARECEIGLPLTGCFNFGSSHI